MDFISQVNERQHVLVTEESFDAQYNVAHNKFYEQYFLVVFCLFLRYCAQACLPTWSRYSLVASNFNSRLPMKDKHGRCSSCLGPEHAKEELVNRSFCKFCAPFPSARWRRGYPVAVRIILHPLHPTRKQLWLSQAHVPDGDRAPQLDTPITPLKFGPAVDEMLQRSHCVRESTKELVCQLPKRPPPVRKPMAPAASKTSTDVCARCQRGCLGLARGS
ncbi:UNVERIFIED_CONTAM: hypothetical protein FKN15_051152 [Acipenser sinensis]